MKRLSIIVLLLAFALGCEKNTTSPSDSTPPDTTQKANLFDMAADTLVGWWKSEYGWYFGTYWVIDFFEYNYRKDGRGIEINTFDGTTHTVVEWGVTDTATIAGDGYYQTYVLYDDSPDTTWYFYRFLGADTLKGYAYDVTIVFSRYTGDSHSRNQFTTQ